VQVMHAAVILDDAHVNAGIVNAVMFRARADFQIDRIARAAVDQAMTVCNTGLPPGRLAGPQRGLTVVLAQHDLTLDDVDELVFGFMPVALRRRRARLKPREIDPELVEPDRVAEPLALAPGDCVTKGCWVAGEDFD